MHAINLSGEDLINIEGIINYEYLIENKNTTNFNKNLIKKKSKASQWNGRSNYSKFSLLIAIWKKSFNIIIISMDYLNIETARSIS